jgi:hypothetical protein
LIGCVAETGQSERDGDDSSHHGTGDERSLRALTIDRNSHDVLTSSSTMVIVNFDFLIPPPDDRSAMSGPPSESRKPQQGSGFGVACSVGVGRSIEKFLKIEWRIFANDWRPGRA